jgi:hypothetical protein
MARAKAAAPNYGAPPAAPLPDPEAMAQIEAAWDLPPASADTAEPGLASPAENDWKDDSAADATAGTLMIEADEPPAVWRTPQPAHGNHRNDDFDAVLLPMHQSSPPRDQPWPDAESDEDADAIHSDMDDSFDAADPDHARIDDADDADAADDPEHDPEQPAFVLAAQRRQRRARLRRILMMAASVILVFAGLGQGIYLERNRIALAAPALKPLLVAACQPLRCTVGLQRRIDQLSIESNELQAATPDQPALTLSLLLRNRADTALAWPDIELTLNDDDEKALIRRVFAPAEYPPADQAVEAGMAGNTEQPVKLTFTLTQAVASGYRVYLFYP